MNKLLYAGLLAAAVCAARAQDLDRPLLLVADPDLHGLYHRTALLVVPADGGQHPGRMSEDLVRRFDRSLLRI